MKRAAAFALALMGAISAAGQAPVKSWTPPRTADGVPDLSGVWTNVTLTPLQRPADLAAKAFFTPQEAADYAKRIVERNNADRRDGGTQADLSRAYNDFWWDRGTQVVKTLRTSLIIDPPDGKLPPTTPEAAQRRAALAQARRGRGAFDGPEDRPLAERCILWETAGPPMMPSFYNNNYQIVQGPGYVMILVEMIHDVRIIPTDGRPHLDPSIRQWMGDARGHWEGNTLVVETTNFTDKTRYQGTSENLRLIERFTRTDADTIMYEFTVNDPSTFTKPWTAQIPMSRAKGPIIEYACSEGNYSLAGVLAGARADEKKASK